MVTIGGAQSNHCRATACAARLVGLGSHLVVRTGNPDSDLSGAAGAAGNLLFARAAGAVVHTVSKQDYAALGSSGLVEAACEALRTEGERPYAIPVGGSNSIGTWGYISAAAEFFAQVEAEPELKSARHLVFATGSGGTAAGLAAGMKLAFGDDCPRMYAVGVCDDPDYFYRFQAGILAEMGLHETAELAEEFLRSNLTIIQGKGRGYAAASPEELAFASSFARSSGLLLDPVYTNKVLRTFLRSVEEGTVAVKEGEEVLFWHTGGQLGAYGFEREFRETFEDVRRLDVSGIARAE